jgi:hypothetical protein
VFEDFYSTFATVSLTVTGLWMYIASSRFRDWMTDRDHVRRASAITVQLAFPGAMCLFALIDPASTLLWRVAFALTSGVAVVLLFSLRQRSARPWASANHFGNWLAIALFACVGVVAVLPEMMTDVGLPAVPRRTEFFLFTVLLLDGLAVAWTMLFAEATTEAEP